ncbi:MAG: NAD(P)H-dependent glycerol-3-phosphate dehydrogenase [Bdellovibrionota bacterium]|nr:MAG: NAD(P)H-dependent glycerol-3-phosphate dehydrogenase [Bdellovibrionota bacterium]
MKERIGVVGLGNWGTALANHLAWSGHQIIGWSVQPDVVSSINAQHRHCQCLTDIELHSSMRATGTLDELSSCSTLLIALPSAALSEVLPTLTFRPRAIVSAVKGLERTTLQTPLQYFSKVLGDTVSYTVISGPSFAHDVARRMPAGVVAASTHEDEARRIATMFTTEWMRVYISTDTLGVELGGIVKNVIALAVGISDGMQLGDSARAMLITRGLAEIMRLGEALGAQGTTFMGLSGLGDLAMTATSDLSRNRQVGLRLGRGEALSDIISSLGSVAEGVATSRVVSSLARTHGIEMPITDQVAAVVDGRITPIEAVRALITRPLRREF